MSRIIKAAMVVLALLPGAAGAQRATLIFDVRDGAVLHAQNANAPSFPASLTKLMTIYLLLEAIDEGRLSLDASVDVSRAAAAQAPKRLGLGTGRRVRVEDLLLAMIVLSANDASVAGAEAVAGTEPRFVELMNRKAGALGMSATTFRNASGLPDPRQVTTARDVAILVHAMFRDFQAYWHYFSTLGFRYRARHIQTHNNFLRAYAGADGLKTGFTCRAGFNLVASVARDSRHLVGIVLGARTAGRRDWKMTTLFDAALSRAASAPDLDLQSLADADGQGAETPLNRDFIAEQCIHPRRSPNIYTASRWSVEFGLEVKKKAAVALARRFLRTHAGTLAGGRPMLIPRWARDVIFRVGVTDLTRRAAIATCANIRDGDGFCVVLTPEAASWALEQALAIAKLVPENAR